MARETELQKFFYIISLLGDVYTSAAALLAIAELRGDREAEREIREAILSGKENAIVAIIGKYWGVYGKEVKLPPLRELLTVIDKIAGAGSGISMISSETQSRGYA